MPRTLTEILTEIRKAFGGYPYRVGEMLFVPDGGNGNTWSVNFLTNVDSLFSWFQRFGRVQWETGVGLVTQKQLFEELLRSAPAYDTIESVPHEPPVPRAYYACDVPRDGDGSAIEGLLDCFSPASEQDRQLIKAMFLTAFWGGPPGARPAFLITSPFGRGMGKTTLPKMLTRLVGVGEIFDIKPREDVGTIKQRLLTPSARKYRLATLDNLKSLRFSWDDLESLITTPVISGKQMYFGESQRPNYLTWILTVNGASFTRDMAQRVITIALDKPHHTGTWESDTERYIDEHRQEIIADIVTILRPRPPRLDKATRWGTWDAQVLARLHEPETLQRLIVERQHEIDVEDEEAALIHEAIMAELWRHRINPHEAKVLIP
ncbi:MAG: hypothetical protein HYV60_19480, partial [Planctomycetia bacterium]|nr:hypothetical protein [Planctomycetia bacterium]